MPSTSTIDGKSALLRLIVISLFNNCIARVDILRGVGLGNFSEQYFLRPDVSLARKFFLFVPCISFAWLAMHDFLSLSRLFLV